MTLPSTSASEIVPSPPWLSSALMWMPLAWLSCTQVVADDRPVAAVAGVDAVLGDRVMRLVVLDQQVVDEAGEDAPAAVVAEVAVADGDVVRDRGADAGAGAVVDDEAVDDDVGGVLDVDAVGRRRRCRR